MSAAFTRNAAVVAFAAMALACGRKDRPVVVADAGAAIARDGVLVISGDASPDAGAMRGTFLQYNAGQRATALVDDSPAAHGGLVAVELAPPEFSLAGAVRARIGLGDVDAAVSAIDGNGSVWLGDAGEGDLLELLASSKELSGALAQHRAGGFAIGGGGHGAAWFGERIVVDVPSEEAVAEGFPHELPRGAKWAKGFIVHSGTFERGTLGALVMAMAETKVPYGLGLSEGSGVVFDSAGGRMRIVGSEPTVLVDMRGTKIRGASRTVENARVSLLCPGDSFSLDAGQVRFVAGKTRIGGPPLGTIGVSDEDTWKGETLRRVFATLANANSGMMTGLSKRGTTWHRVSYSADDKTKSFGALPEGTPTENTRFTVLELRMDIVPAVH